MKQILLVDDEPAITESLGYALDRAGFETRAARTLEAASGLLDGHRFDCVVLYLMLPDGNGLDWLRTLRQENAIPVLILSAPAPAAKGFSLKI